MNGSSSSSSSSSQSTLRFRHNTSRPCDNHDYVDGNGSKKHTLMKARTANGAFVSQCVSDDNSSTDNVDRTKTNVGPKLKKNKRRRGEIQKPGLREEKDWSTRYLIIITVILMVSIVGGSVYLAYLIMLVNPDLQYHLLDLQKYIKIDESLISGWHRKWLLSSKEDEEAIPTVTVEVDDTLTFNFDTSDIGNKGKLDSDQEEITVSSPRYTIPNSMAHIGDKSEEYARLRQDWDERFPPNSPERSLRAVEELLAGGNGLSSIYSRLQPPPMKNDGNAAMSDNRENYDIYNCPDDPPLGYPREYKTLDILKHWPPMQSRPVGSNFPYLSNNTANKHVQEGVGPDSDGDTAPVTAHLGLCVFDYSHDYEKAMRYRSQEMPFVVRNDPRVAETVERWNDENYRRELFGNLSHSNRSLTGNHDDSNNDTKNNVDSPKMVYHRAERSITNQVLFRHSRKDKKSKPNLSPTPGYDTRERKKSKKDPEEQPTKGDRSPPVPPPTRLVSMTYDQWYQHAMAKQRNCTIDTATGIQYYDANIKRKKGSYFYYFRLLGCGEKDDCERNSTEYLFDEMPFFQPTRQPKSKRRITKPGRGYRKRQHGPTLGYMPSSSDRENLYLVDSDKQRGIHCRFGMPGMIAANHYDASRNAIAVLGGYRRYILSRPSQCPNLGLYRVGHPSARHSMVDWTTAVEDHQNFPNHVDDNWDGSESEIESTSSSTSDDPSWKDYRRALSRLANNATSTEVVLQAGDVLYLPSYWFHYIISLNTNMQCNTRSGRDDRDVQIMADCGFPH